MKRILFCLGFCLLFVLGSCDNQETQKEPQEKHIVVFEKPLNAKTTPSSNTGIPVLLDSYTDNTKSYYLVDVGYISDMYISTLAAVDYTGVPIDFSRQ